MIILNVFQLGRQRNEASMFHFSMIFCAMNYLMSW